MQRAELQTRVLEKLGAPLVSAVGDVMHRSKDGADNPRQEAERTAELLAKTVQLSVAIANAMDLRETDGGGDSVRLTLALLAGSLIAGRYRQIGKMPSDAEIQRLSAALEAALSFSDNFVASAESAIRIDQLDPGVVLADENQMSIQYINCLIPVVNAVAAFSFGRPERKLVQEIAGRLVERAQGVAKNASSGALSGKAEKQAELAVLRGLATLYVRAHEAETERLMAMDETSRARAAQEAGGEFSMNNVWSAFEARVEMVSALSQSLSGGRPDGGRGPDVAVTTGRSAAAPPVTSPVTPPPPETRERPAASAPPPAPPLPAAPEAGENAPSQNPMSFFKAPKRNTETDDGE